MNAENLHIESIELAENQAFISWVKYGTDDSAWAEWMTQHPDQKEKVAEAKEIVQSFQFDDNAVNINPAKLRDRIDASIDTKVITMDKTTATSRKLFRRSFMGIAASIALLMGVMYFLPDTLEVITPHGEAMVYTLPDGSKVNINAGSKIEFDQNRWETKRSLTLDGEAYFEVKKGSKFSVVTKNGTVQVLGTQFNVYSRGDAFEVKCTEGRVSVKSQGKEEILQAGDIVALGSKGSEEIPFQAKYDWRQKTYNYRSADLSEVFSEIERQFNVKVESSASAQELQFTGPMETKDLKKALYMVTWPMNLDYEINGTSVKIIKK